MTKTVQMWVCVARDCPQQTQVVFSGQTELIARKKAAQLRLLGFECFECTNDDAHRVLHHDFSSPKRLK